MTFYALPDHCSFCVVDGRTIFLDLRSDRYIEVDLATRSALSRCCDATEALEDSSPEVERLQRLGLIVRSQNPATLAAVAAKVPTRSLRDERSRLPQRAWPLVPEVFALLGRSRRILKRRGIEAAVKEVQRRNAGIPQRPRSDGELVAAAERFRAARRLIPIKPNCLLDSLTLSIFLARRGQRAHLVFGVKLDPFAAHCWLQTTDSILNDGADTVTAFTPVLVV